MTTQELMSELRKLSRAEQLRVIQMLATELAEAESELNPDVPYEIWSPYDSAEVAATLTEVLEEHQKHRVDNVPASKQGKFSRRPIWD